MSDPPAVTVLTPKASPSHAHHRLHQAPSAAVRTTLTFDGVDAVEIVAPDRYCAELLLDFAESVFPAKLVPGPSWVVRFQTPPTGGEWVADLLTLVERWLAFAPIPCAKMRRGGRSYLIRGPLDAA